MDNEFAEAFKEEIGIKEMDKEFAEAFRLEIEEKKSATGYELYHKTFSDAMQHAYAHAKSKGFIVDPKEIDDKVATGPKKPSSGKTNRYSLKAGRKKVEIQVANLDNKRYELNMYIEGTFDHLAKVKRILNEKFISQSEYFPIVLTKGIRKAIPGVKLVQHSIKRPASGEKIPGLGLQLPGDKGIRVMVQYEKDSNPPSKSFGSGEKIVDIDPETGKKEVTDTNAGQIGFNVWVNEVGKVWKKNEVSWVQSKDFRDPKKVVQFLKTKVKRMAKEEVEIDEAVNLKKLKKEYDDNEDRNNHSGNYLLLAKAFGTPAEVKKIEDILKRNKKQGHTSKTDNDWMYKNINPYYSKIRNEEVEIGESQTLQATMALDDVGIKSKWKKGKLYIAKRDVKKAEKALSKSFKKGGEPNLYFEGIDVEKADMKDVIKDFQDSDAPQFKGKSDKKRKEMAIAAKLSREEKEETDEPKSKKKDKINLKPKLDEKQMKKYKELFAGLREKRAQEGTLKKTVSDYHKKEVKEAVTSQGVEYGEQEFDAKYRPDALYPNLNVNFAKYIDEGLEGPYELSGEVYFYDRKVNMFYSVSGEDYVDEETAKDIAYRLHKDGAYKPELGR